MVMKRIAFIVVYMGKLPNYFQIWLESCRANATVDFLVFTDCEDKFDIPQNVKINYMSFEIIKKRIQSIFEFPICINSAYKLCDYKITYGEVFSDFLGGYDFWGFCDIDLIWGDIRKFITEEILKTNERIFTRGHCTLIKNQPDVNCYYRTLPSNGYLEYKKVYQSNESWAFDEWAGHCGGGTSFIYKENGIAMYDEPVMADINVECASFWINRKPELGKVTCFLFENGKLYACSGNRKTEVLYCHFQKRIISIAKNLNLQEFKLIPIGQILNVKQRGTLVNWTRVKWLDIKRVIRDSKIYKKLLRLL